ncbi:MAG TPA: signal recognition particle-docking protein FtsY [Anaerolineaceae bacterium]|jgi:fused signal recognition particle receptor|nr:signal recognition particle-docking protein FtsY [Anaerolineales bacterium]HOG58325.1 signal recognition particle-docking protein FtsY [Anaerolineaceae bacterium]HOR83118.1 signal recognition particle-docking protein FtsY [Anaerolineaceae bacterium]HPL42991.1 signal recognition particle-docking protein FtsY [Anaerolineaceae bacterium]HPY32448.1 signal recognition particle-docking protein FtsY [Anaerolineaceae bacterium]
MNSIFNKWRESLTKTRDVAFGKVSTFFGATQINEDSWDELEALLIQADLGVDTTIALINNCQEQVDRQGLTKTEQLYSLLKSEMTALLDQPAEPELTYQPTVIMIAGVNGSGKTTTIAKLAARYKNMGKKVLLVAADTYRAAAVDQLEIWSDRIDVPIITAQPGSDPGAVTYDGVKSAISRGSDVALIDTAGRLHTRYNLMEEIKKVYRVAGKALPGAPHYSWIVLDTTTGQNALQQAAAFGKAVHLNGALLAKLDTSAKGGMAFAIKKQLGLPVLYAGLGERVEDLQPFNREAFVDGILEH